MTDKPDTSPEAVERLAKYCFFAGQTAKDAATTLRAMTARINDLENALGLADDQRREWELHCKTAEQRAATLEAKLAKAVDVDMIEQAINDVLSEDGSVREAADYVTRATLAEIKDG